VVSDSWPGDQCGAKIEIRKWKNREVKNPGGFRSRKGPALKARAGASKATEPRRTYAPPD